MYLEHFGLNRPPFKITPDTGLFYPGGSRGEILEAIVYAILNGEGIVKVVGEVGSGKTMLSRMLEIRLPETVDIVYLANPSVAPGDIMHAIAVEMGLEVRTDTSRFEALHQFQAELLRRHAAGRQVVCFVEEAQAMPLATLEEIRLLSNLETHQDKLLQIVLFGQPELDQNLDRPDIRQLRERIVHSFDLGPFGVGEIREYVRFRMQAAGYRGPELFTPRAYRRIANASLGLVRRVNIIGDKALLAAYAANSYSVTHREVAIAVADSEFGRVHGAARGSNGARLAWAAAAGGIAIALGAAAATYLVLGPERQAQALASQEPSVPVVGAPVRAEAGHGSAAGPRPDRLAAAPQPAVNPAPAPKLAAEPGATAQATLGGVPAEAEKTRLSDPGGLAREEIWGLNATVAAVAALEPTAPDSPGSLAPAMPAPLVQDAEPPTLAARARSSGSVAEAQMAIAPAVLARADPANDAAVPSSANRAPPALDAPNRARRPSRPAAAPSAATVAVVAPRGTAGDGSRSALRPAAVSIPRPLVLATHTIRLSPAPGSATLGRVAKPRLLADRMAATRTWYRAASPSNYSIQLMMTHQGNWKNLEQFLSRWAPEQLPWVYVYETAIRGRTWYGVLFSEYDSFARAERALGGLPEELKRHKPYVRKIAKIGPLG